MRHKITCNTGTAMYSWRSNSMRLFPLQKTFYFCAVGFLLIVNCARAETIAASTKNVLSHPQQNADIHDLVADLSLELERLREDWRQFKGAQQVTTFLPLEFSVDELCKSADSLRLDIPVTEKLLAVNQCLKGLSLQPKASSFSDLASVLQKLYSEYEQQKIDDDHTSETISDSVEKVLAEFGSFIAVVKKDIVSGVKSESVAQNAVQDHRYVVWQDQVSQQRDFLQRIPGFRDFYMTTDDGDYYLWDPEAKLEGSQSNEPGRWWKISDVTPQLNAQEVKQRYLTYYHKTGNQDPSAQNILFHFPKSVELTLYAASSGTAAGSSLTVTPLAYRVDTSEPLDRALLFKIYDPRNPELAQECWIGKSINWKVPSLPGVYVLFAELSQETLEVWHQLGPAKLEYYVGEPTRVEMKLDNADLLAGDAEPVNFSVNISRKDGRPIQAGTVKLIDVTNSGNFKVDQVAANDLHDLTFKTEWAPDADLEPGRYFLLAQYEGYRDEYQNLFLAPSRDLKTVNVYDRKSVTLAVNRRHSDDGLWLFEPHVYDENGQELQQGRIFFSASSGVFTVGSSATTEYDLGASLSDVQWEAPADLQKTVSINVYFPKQKVSNFVQYEEAELEFNVPDCSQMDTNIQLNLTKAETPGEWYLTVDVKNLLGKSVEAGEVTLSCDAGNFGEKQQKLLRKKVSVPPLRVKWREPKQLEKPAVVAVRYRGEMSDGRQYASSNAQINIPDFPIVQPFIAKQIKRAEGGGYDWLVDFFVLTPAGENLKVGKLRILTSAGEFQNGKQSADFDLATVKEVQLLWKQKTTEAKTIVAAHYAGTEISEEKEARYLAANTSLVLPPPDDKEPPLIVIRGVSHDADVQPGTRVNIIVSDNSPDELSITGLHIANKDKERILHFKRTQQLSNYEAVLELDEVGPHTLDIVATDMMKNQSRKKMQFNVNPVPQKVRTSIENRAGGAIDLFYYTLNDAVQRSSYSDELATELEQLRQEAVTDWQPYKEQWNVFHTNIQSVETETTSIRERLNRIAADLMQLKTDTEARRQIFITKSDQLRKAQALVDEPMKIIADAALVNDEPLQDPRKAFFETLIKSGCSAPDQTAFLEIPKERDWLSCKEKAPSQDILGQALEVLHRHMNQLKVASQAAIQARQEWEGNKGEVEKLIEGFASQ